MRVIITYDFAENTQHKSVHTVVKNAMKELGYSDSFSAPDPDDNRVKKNFYLPNTTLWHENTTPQQAKKDLLAVAKKHAAIVERLFADQFTDYWAAIPGKKYANE